MNDTFVRVPMQRLAAGQVVRLGGRINADCAVLWIGAAYETKPYPRAPQIKEATREAVLRNERTGWLHVYQFRNNGGGAELVRRAA